MFFYVTGNLLKSDAEALVNTVNCEGYMGKGIAYQFKLQFPENNFNYIKACKSGYLRPGKLYCYREQGKTIINFPTKDKWREKSRLEYIDSGLGELKKMISDLNIKSIAIPPLGSGNGGLIWAEVKDLIICKLDDIVEQVDVYIYEPSKSYSLQPLVEPRLGASALVLMEIKHYLNQFGKLRLQKTAYFMNLFARKNYFKFIPHKYGPYDHSIDIISKNIREFQEYHKTRSTDEAKKILYNKLISESVRSTLAELLPYIQKACEFVNSINSDHELECLATICYIIEKSNGITTEDIIQNFKAWSEEKAKRFTEDEIIDGIQSLYKRGIIQKGFVGYQFAA